MKKTQLTSHWLFALYFVTCAVTVALLLPWLTQVHHGYIDRKLTAALTAEAKGEIQTAHNLLLQADSLRLYDQRPVRALAELEVRQGEYEPAIGRLKNLPLKDNYEQLISYQMQYQRWGSAKNTLQAAVKFAPSSENYAQLAITEFNLDLTTEGCAAAQTAIHKGLNNVHATHAIHACNILKSSPLNRKSAYELMSYGVLVPAEKYLDKTDQKNATDLLTLAQIAGGRGDNTLALRRGEKALAINPTSEPLNSLLYKVTSALGETQKARLYLEKSRELKRIEQF